MAALTLTFKGLYWVIVGLVCVLVVASGAGSFKPHVRSDVQMGKAPTGRSALQKIAHAITLTLGRITFAVLHLFERLGVDMSAVDDALAAWTQYAQDQKAHLADLQSQLETLQQTNQQILADKATAVTAEDSKIADQISAALESIKNPPQPPSPVSTDGSATPAPPATVDTGNPISNPAPTPVVTGDPTTAGEVATDDPTTPVVPASGVDSEGNVAPGVQPQPAGDVPPSTPVVVVTTDPTVDGTTSTVTPSPLDPNAPADPVDPNAPVVDPAPVTTPLNPEDSASAADASGTVDPTVGPAANPDAGVAADPTGAAPADPNAPAGAADATPAPVAVKPDDAPVSAGSLPAGTSVVEVAPSPTPGEPAVIPDGAQAVPAETLAPGTQVTPVQDAGTATS